MNKFGVLFLAVVAGIGPVGAAEVMFPKGDGAWTVEIERPRRESAPGNAGGGSVAVKYEIQRQQDVRRDRIIWSGGGTTERWWYLGTPRLLMEKGLSGRTYFYSPDETTAATAFDETMFRWLAQAKQSGEEKMKGKDCVIYVGTVAEGEGREERKAWIEKESGRPVALEAGGNLLVFDFSENTPARLEAPAALVQRAERARKIIGMP
jgi:hypothetical protein